MERAFTGEMRLVKQGDGILNLPAVNQTYTGNTDIWAGTLNFDGQLLQSDLWLNRFAELNSNGGQFKSDTLDIDFDKAVKVKNGDGHWFMGDYEITKNVQLKKEQ